MGSEELRAELRDPLAIVLTIVVIAVYALLLLIYRINRPDPVFLNMSGPLLYSIALWLVLIVAIFVAAAKVWR